MAQDPLAYLLGTWFSKICKILFSFPNYLLSSWGLVLSLFTVLHNWLFSYTPPQRQWDKCQNCATPVMKCCSVPACVACVLIEVVNLNHFYAYFSDGKWVKEKWKGFFPNFSICTWKFMPVIKKFSYFPCESSDLYPRIGLGWGRKKTVCSLGKQKVQWCCKHMWVWIVLGSATSLSVFVSRTMTCENIDLRDNLLHLGFESSRSHIGFKTTVSVAVILPDNLTFCVV